MLTGLKGFFSEERRAFRALMLVSIFLTVCYGLLRRDLFAPRSFIYSDHGFYLFIIDELFQGKVLFKDIAWQYGPTPLFFHSLTAAVFGNSAATYVATYAAVMILNIGLAWRVLRRCLPVEECVPLAFFVLMPSFIRLGAGGVIYYPLEITLLLLVALFWRTPAQRTRRIALLVGLVLGAMQTVKFGGAFVAGLSIIIIDLVALRAEGWSRARVLQWLGRSLWTLGGFLLVQFAFAGFVFATVPAPIAKEVLWPWYMVEHYDLRLQTERLPGSESIGMMLGTQLPGLVWLVLSAALLIRCCRRKEVAGQLQLVFFGVFYLVGLAIYFKHKWLIYYYSYLLCVPACWFLAEGPKWLRRSALLLLLPACLALPYKIFIQRPPTEATRMPNGQTLWLTAADKERTRLISAALESVPDLPVASLRAGHDPIMVFPEFGANFHFYGKYPHLSRHVWFLPKFVRAYEEEETFSALSNCKAILVRTYPGSVTGMTDDPKTWKVEEWSPFDRHRDAALLAQLGPPIKIDGRWAVFPVKRN